MSDLVAFLLARIGEDEQWANVLSPSLSARVLREVEAKRKIIDMASEGTGLDMQVDSEFRCADRDMDAEPYFGDLMLRALAAVWSDHPDYDPAWGGERLAP